MRFLLRAVLLALVMAATLAPVAAGASEPLRAGQWPPPYRRWSYPAQIPTGPIEEGISPARATDASFLTLPFLGPHYVTSIFDHCGPNYVADGIVCRYDGRTHVAGGWTDDTEVEDWLYYDGHDGIDYGLYYEPVAAAAGGIVSFAGWDRPGDPRGGFGQNVFIDHGNGLQTRYAHLSQIGVSRGQAVSRGQVIGVSGNTGASAGEHLHWGVYRVTPGGPRVPIDPYGWSGPGPDPWPHDEGNLWLGGAPRFPTLVDPSVSVAAVPVAAAPDSIQVSWSSPGGGLFELEVVDSGAAATGWLSGVAAGAATFQGVPGHSYWFVASVRDALGWTEEGISGTIRCRTSGLVP